MSSEAKELGVTQEQIDFYPSKEDLDTYSAKDFRYRTIIENGVAFFVDINNTGTAKGTDVRVKLKAPEEVLFYELYDVETEKEPECPNVPSDPIEKARQRQISQQMGLGGVGSNC